jgi:transcriptional regulator with XRE-family HTH domain
MPIAMPAFLPHPDWCSSSLPEQWLSYLSRLENGAFNVSLDTIMKLAAVLNVGPDELLMTKKTQRPD